MYPPNPCVAFAYRARSEIFASIFSFLTSSHLARSARSGAFHSLLNRRGGYFLQWLRLRVAACLERAPALVHWHFLNLLPAVCEEARTQMVGRGTELPPPPTLLNEFNWEQQSKRALGGVRVACIRSMLWRVFVARYMACIRGTLLMIIPEEPEYILLWLSNCEWNQLDGREAGLDLIIGDFGEM